MPAQLVGAVQHMLPAPPMHMTMHWHPGPHSLACGMHGPAIAQLMHAMHESSLSHAGPVVPTSPSEESGPPGPPSSGPTVMSPLPVAPVVIVGPVVVSPALGVRQMPPSQERPVLHVSPAHVHNSMPGVHAGSMQIETLGSQVKPVRHAPSLEHAQPSSPGLHGMLLVAPSSPRAGESAKQAPTSQPSRTSAMDR
jgi:hypothetical protein